jgi:hypothetical protein
MNIEGLRVVIFSGGMGSRKIPSQKKRPPGGHVVDRLAGKRSQDNRGGHQLPQLARQLIAAELGGLVAPPPPPVRQSLNCVVPVRELS